MAMKRIFKISSMLMDILNPGGVFKITDKGINISGDNINSCITADKNHVCGMHWNISNTLKYH